MTTSPEDTVQDSSLESCKKCVKVLRDLISGLHQQQQQNTSTVSKNESSLFRRNTKTEASPLTLLKAIAQAQSEPTPTSDSSIKNSNDNNESSSLKVEWVDDGVKLHLPVNVTLPHLLKNWTQFQSDSKHDDTSTASTSTNPHVPLALSVNQDQQASNNLAQQPSSSSEPLTIELKCRKCASTGPEAGARAFLMGPQPLSVVVCHNRVQADRQEIEEILTHELVHLYDVQTLQMDLQDCRNLAYSEVRAAKAAECKDSWHPHLQKYCVKQKAICATNNLFPIQGRKCIQKVFEKAFHDNRPFDKQQSKHPPSS